MPRGLRRRRDTRLRQGYRGLPQLIGDLPSGQARPVEFGRRRLPEDVARQPGELLRAVGMRRSREVLDGSRQRLRESGKTGLSLFPATLSARHRQGEGG